MKLKQLDSRMSLKGKTVIIRASLNVPLNKRVVSKYGTWRLKHDIEQIREISLRGGRYVVIGHLGRPGGKRVNALSVKPVATYIAEHMPRECTFMREMFGANIGKKIKSLKNGEGVILENLRFYSSEEKNSGIFAKKIASYGDIYVDEAFSVAHRKHASNVAITKFLPSYAGKRFAKEVKTLTSIMQKPKKPLALIIGGAKVVTKLGVINQFIGKADAVLLGGLVVNTILYREHGVRKRFSKDESRAINHLFALYKKHPEIVLPVDVRKKEKSKTTIIHPRDIGIKDAIIDIGPKTAKMYGERIQTAAMIIWNGPMGLIEDADGMRANATLARIIAKARGKKYIGGGETVEAVQELGLMKKMTFVSTGGGAMLELLAGEKLPGIEALRI